MEMLEGRVASTGAADERHRDGKHSAGWAGNLPGDLDAKKIRDSARVGC